MCFNFYCVLVLPGREIEFPFIDYLCKSLRSPGADPGPKPVLFSHVGGPSGQLPPGSALAGLGSRKEVAIAERRQALWWDQFADRLAVSHCESHCPDGSAAGTAGVRKGSSVGLCCLIQRKGKLLLYTLNLGSKKCFP